MHPSPSSPHSICVTMSAQYTIESDGDIAMAGRFSHSLCLPYTDIVLTGMLAGDGDAIDVAPFTSTTTITIPILYSEPSTPLGHAIVVRPCITTTWQNNPEVDIEHDQIIVRPSPPLLYADLEGDSSIHYIASARGSKPPHGTNHAPFEGPPGHTTRHQLPLFRRTYHHSKSRQHRGLVHVLLIG
jgi:hypothetical protein